MIKTKVIQTPKGRLLVVGGLPEDVEYFTFILKTLFWAKERGEWNTIVIDQKGEWLRLGKLSNITEEQAAKVVEYEYHEMYNETFYKLYNTGFSNDFNSTSAKESFISLVESEVPLENGYGDYDAALKYHETDIWEKEQEKIFTNPVLFWEPQSKKL